MDSPTHKYSIWIQLCVPVAAPLTVWGAIISPLHGDGGSPQRDQDSFPSGWLLRVCPKGHLGLSRSPVSLRGIAVQASTGCIFPAGDCNGGAVPRKSDLAIPRLSPRHNVVDGQFFQLGSPLCSTRTSPTVKTGVRIPCKQVLSREPDLVVRLGITSQGHNCRKRHLQVGGVDYLPCVLGHETHLLVDEQAHSPLPMDDLDWLVVSV